MPRITEELLNRHLSTHCERAVEDRDAISVLENFLRSDGKINTNFACNDKWPNTDGTFEFVSDPNISRRPEQNFIVQIKGTRNNYTEKDGVVKYSLQSLAFPGYLLKEVSADPGILFVVLHPSERGEERVFWKYMSVEVLYSIDYTQNSCTISFTRPAKTNRCSILHHADYEKIFFILFGLSYRKFLFHPCLADHTFSSAIRPSHLLILS